MNQKNQSNNLLSIEISLLDIFLIFWRKKIFIFICLIVFLFFGILNLKFSTFTYEVKLNVIEVPNSQSSHSRNVSSIASIIGLSTNSSSGLSNFDLYKKIFTSRVISEVLFEDLEFMKLVFPGQWDDVNGVWITPNAGFYLKLKLKIKSILSLPNSTLKPISIFTLEQYLLSNIRINNSDDGITTFSIDVTDPLIGKYVLEKLNNQADKIIKKRILDRSLAYADFLNNKLSTTLNKDQRQAIINSIANQRQTQMIASTSLPFVAEKFGEIYSTPGPNKPNPKRVLFFYSIFGFGISFFIVLVQIFMRQ